MRKLVKVTQQNIMDGLDIPWPQYGCSTCPVAQAIRLTGTNSVSVSGDGEIALGGEEVSAPRSVRRFVRSFDEVRANILRQRQNKKRWKHLLPFLPKPFNFYLEIN